MTLDKQQLASLKQYLDREATAINSVDFIKNDPVQFPRRFEALRDIEIAALLSATIAWGNRKMICNNCEKMLAIMEGEPAAFVDEAAYEDLPDEHRHLPGESRRGRGEDEDEDEDFDDEDDEEEEDKDEEEIIYDENE